MNVKEHIEAGHYPRDHKDRPLVPMRGGLIATVLSTDKGFETIWAALETGAVLAWNYEGENWGPHRNCRDEGFRKLDLMPPKPRNVKVARFLVMRPNGETYSIHHTREQAKLQVGQIGAPLRIIELTGEYEEPWQ